MDGRLAWIHQAEAELGVLYLFPEAAVMQVEVVEERLCRQYIPRVDAEFGGTRYIAWVHWMAQFRPSNSMLESGQTTQWDYPENSGFGRPTEREWGSPAATLPPEKENQPMRIYIIGHDGITICREPPVAVNEDEIVVALNEELHAAELSGKRLLALWNALPSVEKRRKVTTATH